MEESAEARALHYFRQGYSCAQSVFASLAPRMQLEESLALRLASGFGAGVGRMRGLCGAFSGLTLAAGYAQGNLTGHPEDKERIYSLVREQAAAFREEFGSLRCRDLLQLDSGLQEQARPSERTPAYYAARPCERCVAFCARRAAQLLGESPGEEGGCPSH